MRKGGTMGSNYDSAAEYLKLLDYKRHDWLNHLQVIKGYLSMNDYGRLHAYVKRLLDEAERESAIAHLGYPPLSYYLLTHNVFFNDVVWHVHTSEKVKVDERQGLRVLKTIEEIGAFLRRERLNGMEEPLNVTLTIAAYGPDVMLYLDWSDQRRVQQLFEDMNWAALAYNIAQWGGQLMLDQEKPSDELAVCIPAVDERRT